MNTVLIFLSLFSLFIAKNASATDTNSYEEAKAYLIKKWEKQAREPKRQPASVIKEKSTGEKIEEIVMGGKNEELNNIKNALDEEDSRTNILEVSVSPGLLYFEAKSDSYYRKMRTYSPSLYLGATIWFSPLTGFTAEYLSSMGATLRDDTSAKDTSIVSHEWFRFEINKRFFVSKSNASINASLVYKTYAFKAPADSPTRGNIESSFYGFGIHYTDTNLGSLSKLMGARLYLFGTESERGAVTNFSSGTLDKSYSFEVYRKWKYRLNRKNIFYLNLQYQVDKHIYAGQATPVDPKLGDNIEGLEVESNFLFFNLGYEWGS